MNVAAAERARKEARPQDYCEHRDCLWQEARSGACPRHSPLSRVLVDRQMTGISAYSMDGPAPMFAEPESPGLSLRERLEQPTVDLRRPW